MHNATPELYFFAGKGGVGKSTVSALTALGKSRTGQNVVLVSMDPAHNLSDIFNRKLSEKPAKITESLSALEINLDRWIKKYLKEAEENISRRYNYHKAFGIKNYFKVMQFSPGIEEYAMLKAFEAILVNNKNASLIIFDMPPTAMTLRFFSIPGISLSWISELVNLRKQIYKKQEIISNIKFGNKNIETDNILDKLQNMQANYKKLQNLFESENSKINLVVKPDKLAKTETLRIVTKLKDLNKSIHSVIVNESTTREQVQEYKDEITAERFASLPPASTDLTGIDTLNGFADENIGEITKF